MADESEILRVLNDPRLSSGQRMRLAGRLTGTPFFPHGAGFKDVMRCQPKRAKSTYLKGRP